MKRVKIGFDIQRKRREKKGMWSGWKMDKDDTRHPRLNMTREEEGVVNTKVSGQQNYVQ